MGRYSSNRRRLSTQVEWLRKDRTNQRILVIRQHCFCTMHYGLCVTDYALDTELVPFLDEPALHPIIGASQSILPERKYAHVPLPGSPAVVRGGGWKDASMK